MGSMGMATDQGFSQLPYLTFMTKDKKQRTSHHGTAGLREALCHWMRRFHKFMHSLVLPAAGYLRCSGFAFP
jgi:hypothetical protein